MKVCIETYGCSNNIAESRIMEKILRDAGFHISDVEEANVVVINSCSVKSTTENRILQRIRELQREKRLVIAGCMPESEYNILRETAPSASLLSTHHINEIGDVVEAAARGEQVEILGKARLNKAEMKGQRAGGVIEIIPIASGCTSFCTFCSTKLAKGQLFSFPEESIVKSVKESVREGVKEIWITSQDNGCYGFDRKTTLANLMKKILKTGGDYILRIGMMNPEHVKKFSGELTECYKDERVFKFIHLPVQSGSDEMLRKMGRRYTTEEFSEIVRAFRKAIPEITIWTDVIVGFPGETEEDFEKSMKIIEETDFDFVNVSAYGNRPDIPAARLKQTDTKIKKERTKEMSALVAKTCKEANERWLGWEGEILIDEYKSLRGNWIGRNYTYKPVVVKGDFRHGQKVNVKITGASITSLFGEVL